MEKNVHGQEKFGSYDDRVQVGNKLKILHSNLLKQCVERSSTDKSAFGLVSVAVLESNLSNDESYEDELLTTPYIDSSETPAEIKISDDLTIGQKQEVSNLLHEFSDVLTDSPGLINLAWHEIRTTTGTPIIIKQYPVLIAMTKVVNQELDKMLQMNIIEPSESAFSSQIVMVRKKIIKKISLSESTSIY